MYTNILSAEIIGLEVNLVQVEVDVSNGFPGFSMVGNLNHQVKEAQDRVKTALNNIHIHLPPKKITINISPGNIQKTGTKFDLPIAAGILKALEIIPADSLNQILVVGEIGLDGKIKRVNGILPMVLKAKKENYPVCIVPKCNLEEAQIVDDIRVIGVEHLNDFILCVKEKRWEIPGEKRIVKKNEEKIKKDFLDVKGQIPGKRASLIAVAGFHNLLLLGPPGVGKTMIAERISGLLPELTKEEQLELSSIYSIAGMLPEESAFIHHRPFRAPHHTITPSALVGGGKIPVPGEITLAHCGVLFLDELPEMKRGTLEQLRQPLEEGSIMISRVEGRYHYPAKFLLVAAMNPCPCGYYPDRNRCNCTQYEVSRYLNHVSQPLLDRMDLAVEIASLSFEEFRKETETSQWTSIEMTKKVVKVHEMQKIRYKDENFQFNSEIPTEKIVKYCSISEKAEDLLQKTFAQMGLTGRSCNKILKVARTIADLEESEKITELHLAEAIGFRSIDKNYWK